MRRLFLELLIVVMWLTFGTVAFAQTTDIRYGSYTAGSLDASRAQQLYSFSATQGDLISAEVIALSGGLDPRISLLNANNTPLTVNQNDPFQAGSRDARLTYRLPTTANYLILVEAEAASAGQFLLRLEQVITAGIVPLSAGIPLQIALSSATPTQLFSVDSLNGDRLTLTSDAVGLGYVANVRNANGETLGVINGATFPSFEIALAPSSGSYEVEVSLSDLASQGGITLLFGVGGTSANAAVTSTPDAPVAETTPADGSTPPTEGTPEASADGGSALNLPANRCVAVPVGGGVNIRKTPDVNGELIGSILPNEYRFVEGTNNTWYKLAGEAWISSGVVKLEGPCNLLPVITTTK
ncbi:MAG: hypothetical protein ACOYLB_03600 [Phototrophicaceae bacterium]